MPFWLAAPLSALLFILGLVGWLWQPSPIRRAMSGLLMLQGALLLCVVTGAQHQQLDAWAAALLVLALLPAEYAAGWIAQRRMRRRSRDRG